MKITTKIILCLLIIILWCLALSESEALHSLFRSIDANEDGKIDRDEFTHDMKENAFNELDKNQNKEITEGEWVSLDTITEEEKHRELFKAIDKDKDRRITFFEFSDYADRHSNIHEAFIGLDKDNNSSLTPDEITMRPLFKMITIRF